MPSFIHSPGSTSTTDSPKKLTGTANINNKLAEILSDISDLKQLSQRKNFFGEWKSENIDQQKCKTSKTSAGDSDKCFH